MIDIPYNFTGSVDYQSYSDIEKRIKMFDRFYQIGKDQSGEYDMYLIELGTKGKPTLFLTSTMHGTEWHATQYSMKFMEDLRDNVFPDKDFRNFILNNFCIAYIPVVNPWGMDRVTDEYLQFNNEARYNVNGVELNDDFYYITQQESKNVAEQINKYMPFAYLDMHMFQPEYNVSYGNSFIIANGQNETNNVRNEFRESWSSYNGKPVTMWTNTLAPDSGLTRAYVARRANPYTPHTLAYITELERPARVDGVIVEPLTKEEIFKYGTASLYLFFKTSIQYYMENFTVEEYKSQTMFVRDLKGVEYRLQATTTHEFDLNGNQSISFSVLPTKVNKRFIDDISEMWEVIDDRGVVHKIVYCKKQGVGPHATKMDYSESDHHFLSPVQVVNGVSNGKPVKEKRLKLEIKAIPLFFDAMDNSRIYEEYNEHMPAQRAFSRIFEGMPFEFVIVGQFDAVEWEGFGAGESRLETFKRVLERYKMEFRIVGNIIYLEHQIGRDTSIQYRHKLNASNIVKEVDANENWTYAKGYGNYGNEGTGEGGSSDWQDAKLVREYTSPLAKIIGIRHAPPIKDGRITNSSTMDKSLKILVEESLKVSITADIHDISRHGYALMQAEMGDRVFVIDERIGLDQEVRVTNVSVTKDWRGYILDLKITIGSEGLAKRHQSNLSTAAKQINELIEGRRKLPFSVLDEAVKNATKALQNAQTELIFGNGIIGKDKKNPNYLTVFNSRGLGVSDDGGNTFTEAIIAGLGINASAVVAGTMVADFIAGGILASLNGNTNIDLNNGVIDMKSAAFILGSGASIDFTSTSNRITYQRNGRTAGVGITTSINETYPVVFMGTTGTPRSDFGATDERWFRGFIANTRARMNEEESGNSVVGRRFRITDEPVSWSKGFEFNLSGNKGTLLPIVNTDITYDLGVPIQPFRNLYAENLRDVGYVESNKDILFRNTYDNSIGWTMRTVYDGNPTVDFYPVNTGTHFYNLGTDMNYINRAYLSVVEGRSIGTENNPFMFVYTDSVIEGSDEILKEEVTDNALGLGFVNDIRTVNYKLARTGSYKVGMVAQELLGVLNSHGFMSEDQSMVIEDDVLGVAYMQLIPPLIKAVQELDKKINKLEGA